MPPRRKRGADNEATELRGDPAPVAAARVTRSATRATVAGVSEQRKEVPSALRSADTKTGSSNNTVNQDEMEYEEEPKKKARGSGKAKSPAMPKPSPSKAKAKRSSKATSALPAPPPLREPKTTAIAITTDAPDPPRAPPQTTKAPSYSHARTLSLFETYADADNGDVISPEGFERLCKDAGVGMDGAGPLVLAWLLDAEEMGKVTKDEWGKGLEDLRICALPQLKLAIQDVENFLILHKDPPKRTRSGPELYNRTRFWNYTDSTSERPKSFQKLYSYCFALAKPPQSRNIDIETATAFWSVLLGPHYPIISEVIEFINEKGTLKGVNKDLWSMMLEFAQTVQPDLGNYEADGAWPTTLDDFVAWKKAKTVGSEPTPPVEDEA